MRILIIFLAIILLALGWQVFVTTKENWKIKSEFKNLSNQFEAVKKDNEKLKSDLEYYQIPENLEKELKTRFNYKNSGEQTIIITQ